MNPYNYANGEQNFSLQLKQTTPRWLRYSVDFPTAHPTQYEECNTVRGEYFQPQDVDKAPLVILLHGMGDASLVPCNFLARALAKRGMACFVLRFVFHSSRMPEAIKKRFPALTPEEWHESYQISVTDVQQIADWANSRAEIDEEQIAVIGMSFGGFISAITMGIDKRIKAGVFIITGGNSEKIGQKGRKFSIRKRYRRSEAEYNHIQDCYAQYLSEVAEKGFENATPARNSFLTDPMTFASYLRERPILMLNARWDEYIPKESTLDLWEACGRPAIAWFPATHSSIWLWYPFILRRIYRFLSSTFGIKNERPA